MLSICSSKGHFFPEFSSLDCPETYISEPQCSEGIDSAGR